MASPAPVKKTLTPHPPSLPPPVAIPPNGTASAPATSSPQPPQQAPQLSKAASVAGPAVPQQSQPPPLIGAVSMPVGAVPAPVSIPVATPVTSSPPQTRPIAPTTVNSPPSSTATPATATTASRPSSPPVTSAPSTPSPTTTTPASPPAPVALVGTSSTASSSSTPSSPTDNNGGSSPTGASMLAAYAAMAAADATPSTVAHSDELMRNLLKRFKKISPEFNYNASRALLKEGWLKREATLRNVDRLCMLFNDVFVLCEVEKPKDVTKDIDMKQVMDLRSVTIVDDKKAKKGTFKITAGGDKAYMMIATSDAERDDWVNMIRTAANAYRAQAPPIIPEDTKVESKDAVTSPKPSGTPTLLEAAARGDHDGMRRRLAKKDTKLDEKDSEGNTPLHVAVTNGDVESVQLLIDAGASADVTNILQHTPLHLAAARGLSAILTILIETIPIEKRRDYVNRKDGEKQTALWSAAMQSENTGECMNILIEEGCDTSEIDSDSNQPLAAVLARRNKVVALEALIANGANMGALCPVGNTPLHHAARAGSTEATKLLFASGALPNVKNHSGSTALHITQDIDMALLLVFNGARPDITNLGGFKASQQFDAVKEDGHQKSRITEAREAWLGRGDVAADEKAAREDKNQWVADDVSDWCLLCGDQFSWTKRKHHCRRCGVLCCDACSSKKFVEPGKPDKNRACDGCYLQLVEKRQQRLMKKREEEKKAKEAAVESKAKTEARKEEKVAKDLKKMDDLSAEINRIGAASAGAPSKPRPLSPPKTDDDSDVAPVVSQAPARGKASATAQASASGLAGTKSVMADNKDLLLKRGERLARAEQNAENMANHAADFASLAAKLRQKQESSWF